MRAPPPTHILLGQAMRAVRDHLDVAQAPLAARMGHTRSYIAQWENAHELPRPAAWQRWLTAVEEIADSRPRDPAWLATLQTRLSEAKRIHAQALRADGEGPAPEVPDPSLTEPVPELPDLGGRRLARMPALQTEAVVEHLQDMWHALVRADNLFGPRHTLASVQHQLSILEALLDDARGQARGALLRTGARYAESAAWLHEDAADLRAAERWTMQALQWAAEAGDQTMLSWTLFRRSQQATTRRNAGQAISLAQAAQQDPRALTGPMRAAAMQQEAQGYALDGDEFACHRTLDEAHTWAAAFGPDHRGDARAGHGDFCTLSYLEIQRAGCWLTLGRPDRAVTTSQHALATLPEIYRRDRGLAQARLALAYATTGEPEHAAAEAMAALEIAGTTGSARTLQDVGAAANALTAARKLPVVAELFTALSGQVD